MNFRCQIHLINRLVNINLPLVHQSWSNLITLYNYDDVLRSFEYPAPDLVPTLMTNYREDQQSLFQNSETTVTANDSKSWNLSALHAQRRLRGQLITLFKHLNEFTTSSSRELFNYYNNKNNNNFFRQRGNRHGHLGHTYTISLMI